MPSVDAAWGELTSRGVSGSLIKLDEDNPANLYAAFDSSRRLGLIAMNISRCVPIEPFVAVEIVWNKIGQSFQLEIWLKDDDLAGLFSSFCRDVAEYTSQQGPEPPIERLLFRLESWRRLLEIGKSGLNRSELRGLVGELSVIEHLSGLMSSADVVQAWNGGFPAAHDFVFEAFHLEAKAVGLNANSVKISSLDQLDNHIEKDLFLAVTFLAEAETELHRGFTLPILVERIRALIDGPTSQAFDAKLVSRGFISTNDSSQFWYRVDSLRYFNVKPSFPKLIRANVVAGITSASYNVALSAVEPYEILMERLV